MFIYIYIDTHFELFSGSLKRNSYLLSHLLYPCPFNFVKAVCREYILWFQIVQYVTFLKGVFQSLACRVMFVHWFCYFHGFHLYVVRR